MSEAKRIKLDETFQQEKARVISEIETIDPDNWLPPPLRNMDDKFNSITYELEIPPAIKLASEDEENEDESIILGVDEAGRGPILGPMVYSIGYCKNSFTKQLKKYGFDDSKVLKHDFRLKLYKMIDEKSHELRENIGYLTTVMSAKDISSGMLKVHESGNYNLNQQAHDTTIALLERILVKVKVSNVYIDTVGPPEKYQAKLYNTFRARFPTVKFTVTKKADSIYPIVSCASIIAKVTRDLYLEYYNNTDRLLVNTSLGSGYPADPNTSNWLKQQIDPVFGWHYGILRFSWQTAKDNLEKFGGYKVDYETASEYDSVPNQFNVTLDHFGHNVNM